MCIASKNLLPADPCLQKVHWFHTNLYFTLAKWGILTKITTQFLTMLNCQMFNHFVSGFKFFLALLAIEMFLVIMFFQMRPIFHDLKTMLALVRVYTFGSHTLFSQQDFKKWPKSWQLKFFVYVLIYYWRALKNPRPPFESYDSWKRKQ